MNTDSTRSPVPYIEEILLGEYGRIMEIQGPITTRFILIAVGIEYLGTCLDRQHAKATGRSEKRFNLALQKLFPAAYHHFTQPQAQPNLYLDFRCPVIHRFAVPPSIRLVGTDGIHPGLRHLSYDPQGALILVAEDFYRDLAEAGRKLINRLENK